jgi:hypothetical protein
MSEVERLAEEHYRHSTRRAMLGKEWADLSDIERTGWLSHAAKRIEQERSRRDAQEGHGVMGTADRIQGMDVDEMLGIDRGDPVQRLACDLIDAEHQLLSELRAIRERQGLSIKEVAYRMGVSESHAAQFETLSFDPPMSFLTRYALAVGVMVTHSVGA